MTYARARLWLGISGVGTMVVLSLIALRLDLPNRFLSGRPLPVALAMVLGAYVLISFPFDLLGGYLLPKKYERAYTGAWAFLTKWLRGVFWQSVIMALCGYLILAAARLQGLAGAVVCVAVLMMALLLAQAPLARLVGGLREVEANVSPAAAALQRWGIATPGTVVYNSADSGFVGGFAGWPGRVRIVIPAFWLTQLSPEVCALQIVRRAGTFATGAWTRGVAFAMLWNLAGFTLAAKLSGSDLSEPAGLMTTALWFTVWSFGGLLILPSLSRPAVFAADRFALDRGVPKRFLEEGIVELDRLQDDEPVRAPWVERIFHPVPSATSRLRELPLQNTSHGAWQCARTALYLSWACLGFLPRAVHCNSGRPELWVLFPGD